MNQSMGGSVWRGAKVSAPSLVHLLGLVSRWMWEEEGGV